MPTSSSELAETLGALVSVSHRLTRYAALAAGSAESPAVWRTLSALRPAPTRLGDLAAVSRVSQPTMTKLVASLESRGWIAREPDPADGRASLLRLTDDGATALDGWRARLVAELLPRFADADPDEVAALATAVAVIDARIDAAPGRRGAER